MARFVFCQVALLNSAMTDNVQTRKENATLTEVFAVLEQTNAFRQRYLEKKKTLRLMIAVVTWLK